LYHVGELHVDIVVIGTIFYITDIDLVSPLVSRNQGIVLTYARAWGSYTRFPETTGNRKPAAALRLDGK
jgi:hypothetical protein